MGMRKAVQQGTMNSLVHRIGITATQSKRQKAWGATLIFIGPTLVYFLIFIIYPLVATFYYSFHELSPQLGRVVTTFVGLENYKKAFTDDIFLTAVRNTAIWGVLGPALDLCSAIVLSIIVYFKVPLHRFFRTVWFFPVLVSGVIIGLVFRWVLNQDWGLLNTWLRAIGLDQLALNWLGRKDTPLFVVILIHWWSVFGYTFVLALAGLTAIPSELIEAAYVDGATRLQVARRILLPMLRPTLILILILSFIGKMQAFNVVWVLTRGGPVHYSETVATYIQKRVFHWGTVDLGYPSALAAIWFGVVIVFVGLIQYLNRTRQE
jgi:ABC-type sugar transport system permease subunit